MAQTVGIVGGSISGNKGAEAMVTTVIGLLRRRLPDVRFVLFSPYYKADKPLEGRFADTRVADGSPLALVIATFPPVLAERLLRRIGVHPARWFAPSRLLSGCDALVDLAGISFSDGREIYLPFNILTILPAMMLGVPVAKLAQAMGPFRRRLNRACARALLPRCSYLVARGESTADNLRQIGLDCPVSPDVAFALNDVADMAELPEELEAMLRFGDQSRAIVGVCPSSVVYSQCHKHGMDYVAVMSRVAADLIGRGYRVLLLAHSMRPGRGGLKNNDLPVVRQVHLALGRQDQVRMIQDDLDSIALRRLIGRCEMVLASRYHAMVAALATAVPVIVCGWGHKYRETLDVFGLGEYAVDYRSLSAEAIMQVLGRLEAGRPRARQQIRAVLPDVIAQARRQVDDVADMLEQGRRHWR